jgi:hypothetical protein
VSTPQFTVVRCLAPSLLVASVLAARPSLADEPVPESSPWQTYFRRLAHEYRMTAGEQPEELKLVASPVLKWSQPVRGGQDGAVYLWLQDHRPAAVGTFFIWPNGETNFGISHELHALTGDNLEGNWRQQIRWRPGDPAMAWQSVPDAPPPSDSAAKRSIEARQIARRFAAKSTDRNSQTSELRLQPRAFYEYQAAAESSEWLGGALFSLAHGTDTEIVVWLEAVKAGDKPTWKFTCARMSDLALAVTLDGKEVWRAELAKYNQFDAPYLCTSPEFLKDPPPDKRE